MLSPALGADEAPGALDAMVAALGPTNAGSVKQYMESISVQLLRRRPELFGARVLPLLQDYGCK